MGTITMLSTQGIGMADLTVVATSITLVFFILILLCLVITLEGKFFDAQRAAKEKKAEEPIAPAARPAAAAPVKKAAPAPAPAPAVAGGIPGEIVAAISAAVYAVTGGKGTVKSIRKAKAKGSRRGVWGDAGVSHNTHPFE